jgi:CBS domain-containing protein
MKIKEIMTKDVCSCRPDSSLSTVIRAMKEHDCGIIPVTDEEGKVAGVITDRDIALAVGEKEVAPSGLSVGEVMTAKFHACLEDGSINDALKTMEKYQVRRLPVLDEHQKLIGIISMNDLALHARKSAVPRFDNVINTLKGICKHREKMISVTARPQTKAAS